MDLFVQKYKISAVWLSLKFLVYNSDSAVVGGVLYSLYRQAAQGGLLARVQVGGEVGEVGLGRELPQEVQQVLLDVQRVHWVCLAVQVLLLDILEVVLSRGEELAEVNALLGVAGVEGGVTVLTVALPLVIIRFIL